jgi:hypothetical protein
MKQDNRIWPKHGRVEANEDKGKDIFNAKSAKRRRKEARRKSKSSQNHRKKCKNGVVVQFEEFYRNPKRKRGLNFFPRLRFGLLFRL